MFLVEILNIPIKYVFLTKNLKCSDLFSKKINVNAQTTLNKHTHQCTKTMLNALPPSPPTHTTTASGPISPKPLASLIFGNAGAKTRSRSRTRPPRGRRGSAGTTADRERVDGARGGRVEGEAPLGAPRYSIAEGFSGRQRGPRAPLSDRRRWGCREKRNCRVFC